MLHKYTLLKTDAYVSDVVSKINSAKHRVFLSSTTMIADDDNSSAIITSLKQAAERGLEVSIAADAFTYTEFRNFNFGDLFWSKRARRAKQLSKEIRESGAKVHWMGEFSVIAIFGRTHSKWCVVDDTCYTFGGINLDKRSFTNLDYMLRTKSSELAGELIREHNRMIDADKSRHPYRSYSFEYGKDKVLVDGGFIGNSIIYKRACQLTKKSKKVTLVSQYCPTGKLSRLLKKTDSKLYFNHWSQADGVNKWIIRTGMRNSKLVSKYQRVPYLHAKYIIFELKNGKKVALTGSNNFVYAGVLIGTREIALETTNQHLIKQLEGFLAQNVA